MTARGLSMSSTSTPLPSPPMAGNLPVLAIDMPVLFEDEGYEEMGESIAHSTTEAIIRFGLYALLGQQPGVSVLSNLNLFYHPLNPKAYVSPDVMVVRPSHSLGTDIASYTIAADGPAPFLAIEVLSERTHQQRDLTDKVRLYAQLGVSEYIVVDVTGQFLPERLVLRRLRPDGTWDLLRDADGGITSQYGFRFIVESDGMLRVIDTAPGRRLPRPHEAMTRVLELEAELARLRQSLPAQ
jgi:Uma2 family endonuclease